MDKLAGILQIVTGSVGLFIVINSGLLTGYLYIALLVSVLSIIEIVLGINAYKKKRLSIILSAVFQFLKIFALESENYSFDLSSGLVLEIWITIGSNTQIGVDIVSVIILSILIASLNTLGQK